MESCPFCEIAAGRAPARIVYETEGHMAFFPLMPATYGHTLVIPRRHYEHMFVVPVEEVGALWQVAWDVGNTVWRVLRPEGMNVITSAGGVATQTVMHVHVHCVPRWEHDGFGPIWPEKKETAGWALDHLAELIRSAYDRRGGS
jgi:histidine triad (HIT) family protein